MFNSFMSAINQGVEPGMDQIASRKIRISNSISWLGSVGFFLFLIFNISGIVPMVPNEYWVHLGGMVIFSLPLLLNRLGKTKLAMVVLALDMSLALSGMAIAYGSNSGLLFMLVGLSIFPNLFFDSRTLRVFFLLLNIALFITVTQIQLHTEPFMVPEDATQEGLSRVLYFNIIILLVTMYLVINLFRSDHELYTTMIERTNEELSHANEAVMNEHNQVEDLNQQLKEKAEQIVSQRDMLEATSRSLLEKNQNITASIQYAERIQKAILPPSSELDECYQEHFILFKPKDIVSGDFYYFRDFGTHNIITAVDCTGHGVPGAFMSMVSNSLLNQVILDKGLEDPAEILEALDEGLRRALPDSNRKKTRDGFDMGLCVVDKEKQTLRFAGAKNPLYYSDKEGKIVRVKGANRPIGGVNVDIPFVTHEFSISEGFTFYLFSDGYADQFGGPHRRKFMKKRFRNLLQEIMMKPMAEQGSILNRKLEDWMDEGGERQIDDVLVVGVRL